MPSRYVRSPLPRRWVACSLLVAGSLVGAQGPIGDQEPPAERTAAGLSRDSTQIYSRAKASLFQVRVLTTAGRSQISAGSGFVVGTDGLAITNYHVVSSLVLDPERYVAEAVGTGGERDTLTVLKVDVLNDLALVRLQSRHDWPALQIDTRELMQGERLYSLGNPLDLGFAISEGSFNGIVTRPYYPQILFSGALNAGMSGGPAVDGAGRVIGVNVSKRSGGEQLSFLVPARFVAALASAGTQVSQQPSKAQFEAEIARQLHEHQATIANRLLAREMAVRSLGPYRVPVTEAPGIRCWATDTPRPELRYQTSRLSCVDESTPYLENDLRGGYISVQHEYYSTEHLSPLQFLNVYSKAFGTEALGSYKNRHWTTPECTDEFVERPGGQGLPLRAVMCVRAMRKFEGLYDFALITATVDESQRGVITRVRATAVSRDNGERILQAFIDSTRRVP